MTEQLTTDLPVSPALNASDPPPADPPVPESSPEPAARTVPLETFTREVTPLRAKVRDLELAREEGDRKLREANELLARLQRSGADPNAPPPAVPPSRHTPDLSEVEQRAIQLNFERDRGEIITAGLQAFGQQGWQDAVSILGSFGLDTADFVMSVMDVAGRDQAHKVVHSLVQDPSAVAALRNMSPAKRAVEIGKIADKMNTPKPAAVAAPVAPAPPAARTVSRAPAPPPPVEPSASRVKDWRQDDSSEDEFTAGFNETFMKRRMTR